MEYLIEFNDGYKYILCIIDIFSKYVWCVPLKTKDGVTVLNAIKNVIKTSGRSPDKFWSDRGSEFYNKNFQAWLKSNNKTIYSTYDSKSVVVESFIRTLKNRLAKVFTRTSSRNWVDILQKVLDKYNNHVHSTIEMTPTEASDPENEVQVYIKLTHNPNPKKKHKPKFEVGDNVRISRIKDTFEKGHEHNFSYEVFKVEKVLDTEPITYKLIDWHSDAIDGSFYEAEMLKTEIPEYYEVNKILKTRIVGKKKEMFVSFIGWPSKFDLWNSEDQIYDVPKK